MGFEYGPQPVILHELSAGQLSSRWQRAIRLWWLLRSLYGSPQPWGEALPQPFRYKDLRSLLFAPSHGMQDQAALEGLVANCSGTACLCQRSLRALLLAADPALDLESWMAQMAKYTGIAIADWERALAIAPFAVVHRSIRDDLKALVQLGWLRQVERGQFAAIALGDLPQLSEHLPMPAATTLTPAETWDLLRVLEEVAFVQPQLHVVIHRLWEQVSQSSSRRSRWSAEPEKRIFIQLDYILPTEMQEQVDTYQYEIEQLWQQPDGGMMQFETWLPREQRRATVTVYPVCLHYARRAKYLSAYGINPDGKLGWHNYRLDRIASERLTVLIWGDPRVPRALKAMRDRGELPTPSQVQAALEEAWGFNFYLPKAWLLMRFSPWFARWYVDGTERHPTFERVDDGALRSLITQYVPLAEQAQVQRVVAAQNPQDGWYYAGWVRLGDINVVMRLRDWRPQGEVIAPWQLRQQMKAEAAQEGRYYQGDESQDEP